jgi:DNA repair exonuclease SbcCD ATPase subunit
MKITNLKATGIKGQDIDINPAPVTIITGENMSGKSAIKNAVELALLGYVPGLGKSNAKIFELSDGEPMGVELSVDDQLVISRLWKSANGSVKGESTVNLEVPPVMMELGAVFEQSKADRLKYFFNLAKVDQLTWEQVTAAIKSVKVDEPTEHTEKAINNVIALISDIPGDNIQERLDNAMTAIKKQTSAVALEVKDHKGFKRTITRQTDLQLQAPVNNARAKVDAARKAQSEAQEQLAACERALEELKQMRIALSALGASSELPDMPEPQLQSEELEDDGVLAKIDMDLEATENAIEQVKPFCDPDALRQSLAAVNQINSVVATVKSDLANLIHIGKELKKSIEKTQTERDGDAAMECCPTCGGDGTAWKEKLLAKHDKELARLAKEFRDSKTQYRASSKELETVQADLASASETYCEMADHQKTLNDLHGKLQLLSADRNKVIYARQKEVEQIRATNERRKADYEAAVLAQAQRAARDNAERDNLSAKIAAINEDELQANFETAQLNYRGASNALAAADDELRQETAQFSRKQQEQKSLTRCEIAEAELLILKESTKVLLELQTTAIKSTFEPLLQIARSFTDGILKAPLDFHETELGYWRNGKFVKHTTFSGTEEALAYTGLMVALATATNSPVKVAIIDEMGRFSPRKVRPLVMDRMLDLTHAGVIDHFIGIDNDPEFYDSWKDSLDVLVHEVTSDEVTEIEVAA